MQEMIWQKGINWNDYPARFKRSGYFRRRRVERVFTPDEMARLPPQHEARKNPNLLITRHVIEAVELPPLTKILNRVGVIFSDEAPRIQQAAVA